MAPKSTTTGSPCVDASAARVVVRLGRVLARGDDRLEGGALGAATPHGRIELEREVLLGHALAHERQHLEKRGVGDGGGALHAGDLGRVLAGAQGLDGVGRGDEVVGLEQAGPAALGVPGHVVGLEADAGAAVVAGAEQGLGRVALLGRPGR